jgi:hypothetical protein
MLQEVLEVKSAKSRVFQVMLLHNDANQDVEVQEANEVDFLRVHDHLERGGSVFITSRNSQKLKMPEGKEKVHKNTNKMRTLKTFYFDHI